MAIRTGEIFNSLTFGGVNSADYGIYITGEGVFNAPKRAVDMVAVPGRNGSIAIDQGRWENIEIEYPAGTFGMDEEEFRTALSDFRNAIASQVGYQRLTDTYHPDEYRMAIYTDGLEVEPTTYNKAGEFELKFNCKPQRWLTAGEVPVTIGEWGATKTASGEIVTIESEGGEAAKSLEVSLEPIQDLNGYDYPWVGGAGKNKLTNSVAGDTVNGITFTVNSDGTITASGTATAQAVRNFYTNVTPSSVGLTNGTYIVNGCPSGGSNDKYGLRVVLTKGSNTTYSDYGNGATFTIDDSVTAIRVYLYVGNGQTVNITFKPMIRLSSVSDATYEPYTNICPISGRTSVETAKTGKNLLPSHAVETATANGLTTTYYADGSLKINGTATASTDVSVWYSGNVAKGIQGSYKLNGCTNGAASRYQLIARVRNTSASTNRYVQAPNGDVAISTNATEVINNVYINVKSGIVMNNVMFYPMLRLATETDDTYEPYNGETYTTALGRTVYGGTLDVVSGVLTVDRVNVTVNGSENWEAINQGLRYYGNFGGKAYSTKDVSNMLTYATSDPTLNPNSYKFTVDGYINVGVPYTVAEWKSLLATTNLQVVYELATPQTYQLTPQQISLLLGENHLWSDGSITMQYGDDPNSLWNPTRYDAGPLLAVKGHGDVSFNGYTVAIDAGQYGVINVKGKQTSTAPITYTTDVSLYNDGDTIYAFVECDWVLTTLRNIYARSYSNQHDTGVGQTVMEPRSTSGNNRAVGTTIIDSSVLSSQDETLTNTFSFDSELSNGTTVTVSVVVEVTWSATNKTLSVSSSVPHATGWGGSHRTFPTITIEAASTKTYLGDPTLVDCELGEAYKVEDGEIISLNKYIELGSDLPTLSSGANDVTTDNTITELQVTPNWWKL